LSIVVNGTRSADPAVEVKEPAIEINDYYTKIKPSLRQFTPSDVIRASAIPPRGPLGPLFLRLLRLAIRARGLLSGLFFVVLLCLSAIEIVVLRLIAQPPPRQRSRLHQRAAELATEFGSQYPLWPYSILIKSMAWAFLEEHLPPAAGVRTDVIELAIGEGSFSSRIFSPRDRVVGLDVNPVSLSKAAKLPHVATAVVANCLAPPIAPGSFSVLVANNFLHHVSDKGGTLAHWARIAPTILFNESTPLWSESWPVPRLLRALRLRKLARFASDLLNRLGSQDLLPEPALTALTSEHVDIVDMRTYFSENTYLFATLPCVAALNMGAVPEELKRIAHLKPFARITTRITNTLVRLLLEYDERQDRSRDVFVSYAGRSRTCGGVTGSPQFLTCVSCRRGCLDDEGCCQACGRKYTTIDGMLFLLEPELDHIRQSYDSANAEAFAAEHL
jgi:RNA polymerase subunit RPABC4/transcription elongation factor Spt4